MARFLLRIEYVGTRFRGWQIQENARTIQGDIAEAVSLITGTQEFELYGSGRTDAGVHALLQVAHLDVDTTIPPEKLRQDLNDSLPPDINILSLDRVARDFHARHGAIGRSYLYQIARRRTAFGKPFVWWVRDSLDVREMQKAATGFVGFHDFRGFTAVDPDEVSTKVKIEAFDVVESGDLILVRIRGSHFLWKMVRRLVGVLVEVGRGHLSPEAAQKLLDNPAGLPAELTAPPSGLYLEQVIYEGEEFDRLLVPAVPVTSVPVGRRHAPPPSWKVDEGPTVPEEEGDKPRARRPAAPRRQDDRSRRYVPGQKTRPAHHGEGADRSHGPSQSEKSSGASHPSDEPHAPKRFDDGEARGGYKGRSGAGPWRGDGERDARRRPPAEGGSYRGRSTDTTYRKPAPDSAPYRKPFPKKRYDDKGEGSGRGGSEYRAPGATDGAYRKKTSDGGTFRKPAPDGGDFRKPYPKKRYDDKGESAGRERSGYRSPAATDGTYRRKASGSGSYRKPAQDGGAYRKTYPKKRYDDKGEGAERGRSGYKSPSAADGTYRKPASDSGTYRKPAQGSGAYRKTYPKKRHDDKGEGAPRRGGRSGPPPQRRGPRRA